MGNKNKNKSANRTIVQRAQAKVPGVEMTLEEQIATVEDKIIEGVKKLSEGINISLYDLSTAGRELRELKDQLSQEEQFIDEGLADGDGIGADI